MVTSSSYIWCDSLKNIIDGWLMVLKCLFVTTKLQIFIPKYSAVQINSKLLLPVKLFTQSAANTIRKTLIFVNPFF